MLRLVIGDAQLDRELDQELRLGRVLHAVGEAEEDGALEKDATIAGGEVLEVDVLERALLLGVLPELVLLSVVRAIGVAGAPRASPSPSRRRSRQPRRSERALGRSRILPRSWVQDAAPTGPRSMPRPWRCRREPPLDREDALERRRGARCMIVPAPFARPSGAWPRSDRDRDRENWRGRHVSAAVAR